MLNEIDFPNDETSVGTIIGFSVEDGNPNDEGSLILGWRSLRGWGGWSVCHPGDLEPSDEIFGEEYSSWRGWYVDPNDVEVLP